MLNITYPRGPIVALSGTRVFVTFYGVFRTWLIGVG